MEQDLDSDLVNSVFGRLLVARHKLFSFVSYVGVPEGQLPKVFYPAGASFAGATPPEHLLMHRFERRGDSSSWEAQLFNELWESERTFVGDAITSLRECLDTKVRVQQTNVSYRGAFWEYQGNREGVDRFSCVLSFSLVTDCLTGGVTLIGRSDAPRGLTVSAVLSNGIPRR